MPSFVISWVLSRITSLSLFTPQPHLFIPFYGKLNLITPRSFFPVKLWVGLYRVILNELDAFNRTGTRRTYYWHLEFSFF